MDADCSPVGLYFWPVVAVVTCIKLLLMPTYRSTDFEVHRNWLAITHSLPESKWYYDETSEWTLDYPPFFAWFECALSYGAELFDPAMLIVDNLNYASKGTILFQRLSVIGADLVFICAVKEFCSTLPGKKNKNEDLLSQPAFTLTLLLIGNFGLLIVDHIHFQYNGFLFGIMILSITRITQGRNLDGALWFAILLNFKHIYLYIAPAYFIYLLRCYCFTQANRDGSVRWSSLSLGRLVMLGSIVIAVFAVSFGPFIYMGQLEQILSRLFPFKRGLCHAYWAPNFWALYNVVDKALSTAGSRFGVISVNASTASMTGGLVQEFDHTVLPSIPPVITLICTVLSIMPAVYNIWRYPRGPKSFLRCLTLCAYGSFIFGWHVHEKAVLLVIIPLCLLAVDSKKEAQVYILLSTVGHYSLFPLIFTSAETPIKVCLMMMYCILTFMCLGSLYRTTKKNSMVSILPRLQKLYLLGFIHLYIICEILLPLMPFTKKYEFIPLMLTSVYCAIGVLWSWLQLYRITLSDTTKLQVKQD